MARQGKAKQARQGITGKTGQGKARKVRARPDRVRQSRARKGKARKSRAKGMAVSDRFSMRSLRSSLAQQAQQAVRPTDARAAYSVAPRATLQLLDSQFTGKYTAQQSCV